MEKNKMSVTDRQIVETMRKDYRNMIPLAGIKDEVAHIHEINIPTEDPNRIIGSKLFIGLGNEDEKRPVILFIHGGGFVSGDLDTHEVLSRGLANHNQALVLSIDYRLAPEHQFPAGFDDCYTALLWIKEHIGGYGGDVDKILVAGDSAGATLSASLVQYLRDKKESKATVWAQLLFYPSLSPYMNTESFKVLGDKYFPTLDVAKFVRKMYIENFEKEATNPYAFPLVGAVDNLPPALIVVGSLDPLKDECRDYADKLKEAQVPVFFKEYTGVEHGFIQFFKQDVNSQQGAEAMKDISDFIQKLT
ncbi:alpha/beta hydrolase [Chryseobacterium sp. JK1]|uniref:alpha/beta hydrolase n=1 Tax=Chryseobacterium sp. JK1 TaxID=874294 RepID=UPI003D690224